MTTAPVSKPTLTELLAQFAQTANGCPLVIGQVLPKPNYPHFDTLTDALAEARQAGDKQQTARIASALGALHFERGSPFEAREVLAEAVETLRTLGDKPALAAALGNLATVEYYDCNSEQGLAHAQEAVELTAGDVTQLTLHGYLLCAIGAILCHNGKYPEADDLFKRAQDAFARAEDDFGMAWWQFVQAREQARDRGQAAAVIKQITEALPVLKEKGNSRAIAESLLTLADAHFGLNQLQQASEALQQVDNLIKERKWFWYRPEAALIKARIAMAENEPQQAAKHAYLGLSQAGDLGDLRVLTALYRMIASILERDRERTEDVQDALDRAVTLGRARARRVDLAMALWQSGNFYRHFFNRPSIRARSSGYLFEADRMMNEMGITPPKPPERRKSKTDETQS